MSGCKGSATVTTKVSPEMLNWIDREAEQRDVTRAEFVRLLFDSAIEVSTGVQCPNCAGEFKIRA